MTDDIKDELQEQEQLENDENFLLLWWLLDF
jgi:hypothetical protein